MQIHLMDIERQVFEIKSTTIVFTRKLAYIKDFLLLLIERIDVINVICIVQLSRIVCYRYFTTRHILIQTKKSTPCFNICKHAENYDNDIFATICKL